MAPVAGPVSLNPQGRAGPRLPYHGALATRVPLHLSCCVSVLGDRGYSGPSLSATRLLPLDHLSISKPTLWFQKKKVFPCLPSPWCGERSRQNCAEETSSGARPVTRLLSQRSPGCGAALPLHKSTNVVRTVTRGRSHSSPSHLGPSLGTQSSPRGSGGGRLLGNWPGGDRTTPLIGCLILSSYTLN